MDEMPPIEVLLIDQSARDASAVQKALSKSLRFHVTHVGGLAEGLAILSESNVSVVLLDLGLPDAQGLTALGELRRHAPDVPVIVLTASDDEELAVRVAQAGAQEYFVKSQLEEGNLRRTIRYVLERDRWERELRASEQQLRAIIDTTSQCVKVVSAEGTVLKMNAAGLRMVEADDPEAVIGHSVFSLIAPEHRDAFRAFHDAVIQGRGGTLEFDVVGLKGTRRSMQCVASPLPNVDGSTLHLGVAQDVTQRKRAEESLRETSETLESFYNTTPLMMGVVEVLEDDILHVTDNKATGSFFGVSIDSLKNRLASENGVPRAIIQDWIGHYRESDRTNCPVRFEYFHPRAGGGRWLSTVLSRIDKMPDGRLRCSYVVEDVTERKQAEERERSLLTEASMANAKFRAVFEQGPLFAGIMSLDGILLDANRLSLDACGYTRDQVVGKPFWDCAWWNRSAELVEQIKQATAQAAAGLPFRAEMPYFVADGSERMTDFALLPIKNEAGQVAFLFPTGSDITEKRRLAAERDALLSRLQLHIERMPLAYVLFDADFRIVDWNPTAESIFGYSKQEMLGVGPPHEKFVPCSFWQRAEQILNRIQSGDMQSHSTNENLAKDGRTIICEWFNTPLQDNDGNFSGMLCLVRDVTEGRLLEAQLQQAQKMESIGHLAGGVAHDFNNLLTVIICACDTLQSNETLTESGSNAIQEIDEAAERGATLTRQLLAFSRKQLLAPMVLNPNEVISNTHKMLLRLITEEIDLSCRLFPAIWPVRLDPGQVEQVIVNLVVNARDAMPGGGRLTIETSNVEWTEKDCQRFPDRKPGRYVMIVVSDTGSGITPEVKSRMFDPFFTTKEAGKGTGLGLAVVHGIVKQSEGYIDVDSQPGVGTAIKLYFPAAREQVSPSRLDKDPAPQRRGSETILLVEDEDGVRGLVRANLVKQGYTVLDASNGQNAIDAVSGFDGQLDLIITDVVMPVMGGRQLVDRLLVRYPNLKVLYVTGYTDDALVRRGIKHDAHAFLQKPFSPSDLTRKVRTVLDAAACPASSA
ncbi:MAG TPA: PAS domain S-box protein [Pirellulales bacterium]|jgi:PAS domain S-box-containing protein|nr:PAS domain S-box protein [Pirellulales bacterium]